MKSQKKVQPKQLAPKTQQLPQKSQNATPAKTVVIKPLPEPEKPKENLKLKKLKEQWGTFDLDKQVKDAIELQFQSASLSIQNDFKAGKKQPQPKVENFEEIIKKQRAKLKKAEFEEGLLNMRIKHNLLSKKEWEGKIKYLSQNMNEIAEKESEVQQRLGLNEFFIQKNQFLNEYSQANIKMQDKIIQASKDRPKSSKRPKSQSQFGISQEEKTKHEQFMQKLKEQERKRKKLIKQLQKAQLDKQKIKEIQENALKTKKEQEQLKEKQLKLLQFQEENDKKDKQRQEMKEKQDEIVKKLLQDKPLHVKMESKYKEEIELPLLEQKKKKLEEIRNFFKQPLDTKDISQHQRKYESEAEVKQREREKKKRMMLREFNERESDIKSARIIHIDRELMEEEEDKKRDRKLINERMNEYFSQIKENGLSLNSMKRNKSTAAISKPYLGNNENRKGQESARIRIDPYNSNQDLLDPKRGAVSSRNSADLQSESLSRNAQKKKDIQWKSNYTRKLELAKQIDEQKDQIRKINYDKNYLQQIINERQTNLKEKKVKIVNEKHWKNYIDDQNLTDRERFDMVMMRAKQFESQAALDEKMLVLDNEEDPNLVMKAIEVNELYIQSIQAKLQLLNQ